MPAKNEPGEDVTSSGSSGGHAKRTLRRGPKLSLGQFESDKRTRARRALTRTHKLILGAAALAGAVGVLWGLSVSVFGPSDDEQSQAAERLRIRNLGAGQTLEYFEARLGQPANFRIPYKTITFHRFALSEAEVVALVRNSDRVVVAYTVYLTSDREPVDVEAGGRLVALGEASLADVSGESPLWAAGGYCGALRTNYSELSGGSTANRYEYVVATVSDEFGLDFNSRLLCPLTQRDGCEADLQDFTLRMSRQCDVGLEEVPASVDRARNALRPTAITVVAPGTGFTGYMILSPGDLQGLAADGWKPTSPPRIPRLSQIDL